MRKQGIDKHRVAAKDNRYLSHTYFFILAQIFFYTIRTLKNNIYTFKTVPNGSNFTERIF